MLVLCKILGLFVSTLTNDDKYSPVYSNNLTQLMQILLSQKQKNFSEFLSPILKSTLNFEHFHKKMTLRADVFPKLLSPEKVIR